MVLDVGALQMEAPSTQFACAAIGFRLNMIARPGVFTNQLDPGTPRDGTPARGIQSCQRDWPNRLGAPWDKAQ